MHTAHPMPWRFLLLLWIFLALLTLVVPVKDAVFRPPDTHYTGYSLVSVGDIFVYLSFIDQARQGHVLFSALMTPAEQPAPKVFHPLFLMLGWGAALFHTSPLVMWHIGRILLSLVVLMLLWRFLARSEIADRFLRWVMLCIVFSGGLYWINHEGSMFVSFFYSPLSLATLGLTLTYFSLLLDGHAHGWNIGRVLLLHVAALVQAMIHPYILPLWLGVGCFFFVLTWIQTQKTSLRTPIVSITSVGFAYGYLVVLLLLQPSLWEFVFAFRIADIHPFQWASYGIFLTLALVGSIWQWRWIAENAFGRLLYVWFLLNWILLFSPYPYSGRLFLTAHLPAAVFATFALARLAALLSHQRARYAALGAAGTLLMGANALLLILDAGGKYTGSEVYRYLDRPTYKGLQWIHTSTPPSAVFLTSPVWDTLFVQQTGRRAYFTSGGFTKDFRERIARSHDVYAGAYSADELARFLTHYHIEYLLVSALERNPPSWTLPPFRKETPERTGFSFDSSRYPFLQPVYDEDGFVVYHVTNPQPS